jgi:hypothetical protein
MDYLISKYLNKNFEVIVDRNFKIVNKIIKGYCTINDIYSEINKFFPYSKENQDVDSWYKTNTSKFISEFNLFLVDCELILGTTNWEIYHNKYGKLALDSSFFLNKDGDITDVIEDIFDDWYNEKVIIASEKAWENLFIN